MSEKLVKPVEWVDGRVVILDQTRLPWEEVYLSMCDYREVAEAIRELRVRGAPAIGVAAGYGIALGAAQVTSTDSEEFCCCLKEVIREIACTRPTAVNLFKAVTRMQRVAAESRDVPTVQAALLEEARAIHREEQDWSRKIGYLGAELIEEGATVLTHCNAGPLATAGYGTALGVIRAAKELGKDIFVMCTETRPLLQGARLTVWELMQAGVPHTLITDSMAGHFMGRGEINCCVVGADRIAANGDTANKIGTYTLAVLAREHGIPFYVAAPASTIDLSIASGKEIPIEERKPSEITHVRGTLLTHKDARVANPAFDVTPYRYITAIITERGVVREPYEARLKELFSR